MNAGNRVLSLLFRARDAIMRAEDQAYSDRGSALNYQLDQMHYASEQLQRAEEIVKMQLEKKTQEGEDLSLNAET